MYIYTVCDRKPITPLISALCFPLVPNFRGGRTDLAHPTSINCEMIKFSDMISWLAATDESFRHREEKKGYGGQKRWSHKKISPDSYGRLRCHQRWLMWLKQ